MAACVEQSLKRNPWLRDCKVADMETYAAQDDGRKVSGLWGATAVINATLMPPKSGREPKSISIRWKGLCIIKPSGNDDHLIWFELADIISGPMYREHPGPSEWTAAFRAKVKKAEFQVHREHSRLYPEMLSESSVTALSRELQHLAVDLSDMSLDELKEIIELTD